MMDHESNNKPNRYRYYKLLISCIIGVLLTQQYAVVFPTTKQLKPSDYTTTTSSYHNNNNNNDNNNNTKIHHNTNNNTTTTTNTTTTNATTTTTTTSSSNGTRIVAVANDHYKEFALRWYEDMTKLGYGSHLVVAAMDEKTFSFLKKKNVTVEKILPDNDYWPPRFYGGHPQKNRRQIFGTRWIYILSQLQKGYNILLTDVDNIFVRCLPMEELDSSKFDIYHAYCGEYPPQFKSMGFTVCGGMSWFRASLASIRYVETFLTHCGEGWDHTSYEPVICDDQVILNQLIFDQTLNYTFDNDPKLWTNVFWKPTLEGTSQLTGHKFKIWDVHTAYRGPVNGKDGICPKNNWVAMPINTISETNDDGTYIDEVTDRTSRIQQFKKYCRKESNQIF